MPAVLAILRRVPILVWAVIAALAYGGWQRHRAQASERVHTQAVAAAAADREAKLQADAAETARRLDAQKGITDEARKQAQALASDAERARAAEQRLRARLTAIAANPRAGNTAAADGSPAATDASVLLADMFSRCSARVRELGEYADAASSAGQTCQRSYESLSSEK